MGWITVRMQVTSPLFNGGADPLHEAGVRVATLRGAMRFWFRALAGSLTGSNLAQLSDLERRVFGSAAESSPVALRIPDQVPVKHPGQRHDFLPTQPGQDSPEKWIVYLLGQGLGDLASCTLKRPYTPPGAEFTLKLRFRHRRGDTAEQQAAIRGAGLAALWLTCTYGGVGARVRRGFGGLRITDVRDETGQLPASWQADRLRTPGLEHYETLHHLDAADHLASALADIRTLIGDTEPPPVAVRPAFPLLHRDWTQAGLSQGDQWRSWDATLIWAGEQLRYFRASQPNLNPKAKYQPKIKTPEWEAAIHGTDRRFPLGALGLPVVYRDATVDAMDKRKMPARRASALWLRPVGERDTWRLFSFAFTNEFLPGPNAPTVTLRRSDGSSKTMTITNNDVEDLARRWIKVHEAGESFTDPTTRR